MRSSDFNDRTAMLYKYFTNDYRWKTNNHGDYIYYKGKRNLRELKFIISVVFDYQLEILKEEYFMNGSDEVIGGSLICSCFVEADFNGINQGTAGAHVFIKFTLWENGYFTTQASSLEGLEL
ncbi:hypothetical protein [Brevibacillus reuszeri]|uniref:hypothetical protein n=1 Tax=Brevibacillus reuszeri TaxID=54915 RepID=UPI000CCC7684|nr:hypothetical protein [Brevibacillus reuszeri]